MRIETVVGIFILQVTFFAGVFWAFTRAAIAQLRQEQKREADQARLERNNIGDKVRQTELKLFYVAMMISTEEKRQEILNALVRRLT
jgi:hypothetical protein